MNKQTVKVQQNPKKYTVITGASSGIGYETAKAFARLGKNLIITARREENLERLKAEILNDNSSLDVIIKPCDLSVIENAYNLYSALKEYEIETWINNAGFGNYGSISAQNLSKIELMLRLNVEALVILSSLYTHDYRDTENAQIINVSSAGGYTLVKNAVTYCASKFFVTAFTEGLSRELKEAGSKLQAKVLAPAATKTEFGQIANDVKVYDYSTNFKNYHTSQQMTEFLIQLYESNFSVGLVDRKTFQFELSNPRLDYAGNSKYNQKQA